MNYVKPIQTELSVLNDGATYTKTYFAPPTLITGVVDETHLPYDVSTTYSVDAYCIIPELKAIYKSSLDNNTGNYPPSSPNVWTYMSPVNSYNMLAVDEAIGTTTDGTDIVLEFDFSQLTAFSIIKVLFNSVLVELIDNTTQNTVYSENINGTSFGANSYPSYFYDTFSNVTRIYRNLPWYGDATLRFTFDGDVKIGAIVMGGEKEMGCTMAGSDLEYEDSSSITISPVTGFRTVNRYGSVRVLSVELLFDTVDFNEISQKAAAIMGRNILFVPTSLDKFSDAISIGYIENFNIPMESVSATRTNTKIIGVI